MPFRVCRRPLPGRADVFTHKFPLIRSLQAVKSSTHQRPARQETQGDGVRAPIRNRFPYIELADRAKRFPRHLPRAETRFQTGKKGLSEQQGAPDRGELSRMAKAGQVPLVSPPRSATYLVEGHQGMGKVLPRSLRYSRRYARSVRVHEVSRARAHRFSRGASGSARPHRPEKAGTAAEGLSSGSPDLHRKAVRICPAHRDLL